MKTALVLGAGGFIGSHLVKRLKQEGYWVRGVDLKFPSFSQSRADEFLIYDLRVYENVKAVMRIDFPPRMEDTPLPFSYSKLAFAKVKTFDEVYQLAADMGGAGYIFTGEHDADVMHNSIQINLNVAEFCTTMGVGKVFYSSSACMYPQQIQSTTDNKGLKESDAYPGNPDSEYGWEKLFSERLYLAYARNHNLNVRIARFHNIYGPEGTFVGGKEKAPAAICRKVIESKGSIEIWGDGEQTRSFLYIEDCLDAVRLLMQSEFKEPVNIGSEEMVAINELAELAIGFSGLKINVNHVDGPQGVRGRNSNNDLITSTLNWQPKYSLFDGLRLTYFWIKSQYA